MCFHAALEGAGQGFGSFPSKPEICRATQYDGRNMEENGWFGQFYGACWLKSAGISAIIILNERHVSEREGAAAGPV